MTLLAVAGVLALLGVGTATAALAYLHVAPTGLSPREDPVSAYGISRYRSGYRIATLALGVAGLATAVCVAIALPASAIPVALLVIFGLARLAISWFPMDAPGSPKTSTGRIHNLLATAAFAPATAAAFVVGISLGQDERWDVLTGATSVLAWLMAFGSAGVILSSVVPDLSRAFGLFERLIYLGIIVWLGMFAVAAIVLG